MPLPIAHGLVGAAVVAAVHPRPTFSRHSLPLLIGAFLANCPDLDFFLVWTFGTKSWHRAFTHSFAFAFVVSLMMLLIPLGRSRLGKVIAYGLAFMSHGVLDYATTDVGGGVELLWPFSSERLRLGIIGLSEVPSRLPPVDVLKALLIELMIFAPLLVAVLLVRRRVLKRPTRGA